MNYRCLALLVCLLAYGCTDPEVAAQQQLQEVKDGWLRAQEDLDPEDRVEQYADLLSEVERISKDYDETRIGRALAGGQDVEGVSISTMSREMARLKERASCYAKPTSSCLLPYASRSTQDATADASIGAQQRATMLICDKGFSAADTELESLKINRPVYAQNLVQLALKAAECDRTPDVKAAIAAYVSAEPAQGSDRVGKLMSVLQTAALQPAWEDLIPLIEQETGGLAPGNAAGVQLTLAVKQAELGQTEAALEKFNAVAQKFTVDVKTRIDLASALIASGHTVEGLDIAAKQPGTDIRISAIHGGVRAVADRLGLLRRSGAVSTEVPSNGDLDVLFAPVEQTQKTVEQAIVVKIEQALDEYLAPEGGKGMWLGMSGGEATYGLLGLIHQKLGDNAKASALAAKGEKAREVLARPGSYRADSKSYLAEFQVLIALAQGRTDEAIALYPRLQSRNDLQFAILNSLAKQGKAEQALTFAAQINVAGPNTSQYLMDRLGLYGHIGKAEEVLNATQVNASTKSALAWGLVEKAAQADELDRAEEVAQKYNLLATPGYRLRMAEMKAEAAISKTQKSKAETAIREMFTIGVEIDQAAGRDANNMYAQSAAAQAFQAGYTDLGIELYRGASKKDQRPLFDAFSPQTDKADFPKILMVAHDNLQGERLGYVIDSAIRRLKVIEG